VADRDRVVKGYAEAVLAVAEAEGNLDSVEDELYRFARTVERQTDLRDALTDPALPADRKKAVIQDLLGTRANPQTVGLLGFLVEQGLARDLTRVVDALAELAAERRQRSLAEVRTAVPLDAERRRRLTEALSTATGRTLELKVLVDDSVIGGVMARVGDQVFDGTVRRKLELARQQLGQAG
jgi:F-type H+-transporting ATPase subunit delta